MDLERLNNVVKEIEEQSHELKNYNGIFLEIRKIKDEVAASLQSLNDNNHDLKKLSNDVNKSIHLINQELKKINVISQEINTLEKRLNTKINTSFEKQKSEIESSVRLELDIINTKIDKKILELELSIQKKLDSLRESLDKSVMEIASTNKEGFKSLKQFIILLFIVVLAVSAGLYFKIGNIDTAPTIVAPSNLSSDSVIVTPKVNSEDRPKIEALKVDLSAFEKGALFEEYVLKKFDKRYFKIRSLSSHQNVEIKTESNRTPSPDIEVTFSVKDQSSKFTVECLWRKEVWGEEVSFNESLIEGYKSSEIYKNIPLFFFVGIGGQPSSPKEVFVINLKDLQNNKLSEKSLNNHKLDISRGWFYLADEKKFKLH
ncbi:hypothetical protein LNTAR_15272 [Lentisphaera araneosa HTCC2155]|uniref:Uncharacterized protein n=1 Tax=Lentisphaera araneosa HTCC2155 TaxID=313628 RepID=A6DRH9_9BACT|nr:hypothetical protein [Lentisphaera araneosa]EDM25789.1 hypothetical protein LNTAR_15272 [Lentisphaera araneosa HTCC2155]